MGDVINLNQYRKKRELEASRRQAAVNRAKYGRLKADRLAGGRDRERLEREVSGKKFEPTPLPAGGDKVSAEPVLHGDLGTNEDPGPS